MKSNTRISRLALLTIFVGIGGLLVWTVFLAPGHPVALLRVVDSAGKPITGAVIRPEGLRTKPGPYVSGWYGWRTGKDGVPNPPVTTDAEGNVRVPYPKYVFERIETGTLCLSVEHPDYVPARPERMVAVAPPGGSPWRVWFDYVWGRVQHKALVARADPIVLKKGATLIISTKPGASVPGAVLYAQISGRTSAGTNFWLRPGADVLMTRSLAEGTQAIRTIQFESNNVVWFSPAIKITALIGQTNDIVAELKRGVAVNGRLDDKVPRPVYHGRVIAQIYPAGEKAQNEPPEWHVWSEIRADGTFTLASLPEGDLELVAICDGFVNTNGSGQFPSMHYPQKFSLGPEGITVTLGMEPTAGLEVKVQDDEGKPLQGAQVSCWPNIRYGEWSATIIGQDCYNTADFLTNRTEAKRGWWDGQFRSFQATSDLSGFAFIANLPAETTTFSVEHPRFVLPAVDTGRGDKRRTGTISLHPPETNRVTVRLERAGAAPITHF
jgi:hypothetical protein